MDAILRYTLKAHPKLLMSKSPGKAVTESYRKMQPSNKELPDLVDADTVSSPYLGLHGSLQKKKSSSWYWLHTKPIGPQEGKTTVVGNSDTVSAQAQDIFWHLPRIGEVAKSPSVDLRHHRRRRCQSLLQFEASSC